MLLNNLILGNNGRSVNISVSGAHISGVGENMKDMDPFVVDFENALVIPGFINSHDHLDFNCFHPLGENIYPNYTEWGKDIHQVFRKEIQSVLNIPQHLRTAWGIYKNLLSGVTTVVNHGPHLHIENPLIHVFQHVQNLHSAAFEKNWKWKLNNPFLTRQVVAIHTGEGTDERSVNEIDDLIRYNLIGRKMVGIHGVAMNKNQAKKFKALVWCPESNHLLLDKQPDITELKKFTTILLGTDSTLTGNWDFWQHLRFARTLQLISDGELFDMCTRIPAALWEMNRGEIKPGKEADLVIMKNKSVTGVWDRLFETNAEDILMIIQGGRIRLFDQSVIPRLQGQPDKNKYSRIYIGNSEKYVEGDLPALAEKIRSYHQDMIFPFHLRSQMMEAI